jgi:exosortase D (VPLPA-CTERM-specific)
MDLSPSTTRRDADGATSTGRVSAIGGPSLWLIVAPLVLAGFIYAYSGSFTQLLHYWDRAEYSHGYIIPFVALLLAWHDLTDRRPLPDSSWRGAPLLLLGFGCLLIGQLSTFNAVAIYGLILGFVGLSDCFLGRPATRVLRAAFIYLLFAVPLPDFLYVNLSARMQLVSSTLGVAMLDVLGIPVFQDGNIIDLGGLKLQVVEACSGLRYLFPLASFGFLAAYLLRDAMWKRVIVFLSTVPITIILNSVRIALIGVTADRWGKAMAEGFIHSFEGWVIFLVCVGVLMLEIALLRRIGRGGSTFRFDYLGPASGPLLASRPQMHLPAWIASGLVIVFVCATAFDVVGLRIQAPPSRLDLAATIPLRISDWRGQSQTMDPDVIDTLGLTDYFLANYDSDSVQPPANLPVNLYVGYWADQSVGSAAHSPANCIPGGGWMIADRRQATIPDMQVNGQPLKVNRLVIRRDDVQQLVYYWFNQRGRDLTTEWSVKWYLLRDQIVTGRSDGFLVRLVTPIMPGVSEQEADQRLRHFIVASGGSLAFYARP